MPHPEILVPIAVVCLTIFAGVIAACFMYAIEPAQPRPRALRRRR